MLSAGQDGACRTADEDEETVARFEKVLRQQYVIETCDEGNASRHVWNFADWFIQVRPPT